MQLNEMAHELPKLGMIKQLLHLSVFPQMAKGLTTKDNFILTQSKSCLHSSSMTFLFYKTPVFSLFFETFLITKHSLYYNGLNKIISLAF